MPTGNNDKGRNIVSRVFSNEFPCVKKFIKKIELKPKLSLPESSSSPPPAPAQESIGIGIRRGEIVAVPHMKRHDCALSFPTNESEIEIKSSKKSKPFGRAFNSKSLKSGGVSPSSRRGSISNPTSNSNPNPIPNPNPNPNPNQNQNQNQKPNQNSNPNPELLEDEVSVVKLLEIDTNTEIVAVPHMKRYNSQSTIGVKRSQSLYVSNPNRNTVQQSQSLYDSGWFRGKRHRKLLRWKNVQSRLLQHTTASFMKISFMN